MSIRTMLHPLISTFLFVMLLSPTGVSALSTDVKQPISIDANSALVNKLKGFAIYEGNVVVVQGSLKITAHKLEIYAPKNNVKKIVAYGSPVTMKQQLDDGKKATGRGNKVTYFVPEKNIILVGNARVTQEKDTVTSQYIQYLMHTGEIKAGDSKNHSSNSANRVRAVFFPAKK